MTPLDMPTSSSSVSTTTYIFFGVESLVIASILTYLILYNFNAKTWKETFEVNDKKIIAVLLIILLTGGLTFGSNQLINNTNSSQNNGGNMSMPGESGSATHSAKKT